MTGPSAPGAAGLALALAVAAAAWILLLASDPVTGARRVVWHGPDGRAIEERPPDALYPWRGCRGDIQVTALRFDGAMFTVCEHPTVAPHGSLGRIRAADLDAGRARGEIRWVAPADLPLTFVEALAPGPDGRLGVVYRTGGVDGRLAVAVAGRDGWRCPPRVAGGGPGTRTFGAAWVDGALEAVVFPASTDDAYGLGADAHVVRLGEDCTEAVRTIGRTALTVREGDASARCTPKIALPPVGAGGWRFVTECRALGPGPRTLWEVTEDGGWTRSRWPAALASQDLRLPLEQHLDLAATGLTEDALQPIFRVTRAGGVDPLPTPPEPPWQLTSAWHHFEVRDGALAGSPLTVRTDGRFAAARRVDGALVATWSGEDLDGAPLEVSFPGSGDPPRIVARATSFSCGELAVATVLPRAPDGHWLVEPTGCFLGLDARWQRADPLPLAEHLRRRGSIGMNWDERHHLWTFGWALLGLPLATGIGAAAGAVAARIRGSRAHLRQGVGLGLWAYAVTGAIALGRILPLLR